MSSYKNFNIFSFQISKNFLYFAICPSVFDFQTSRITPFDRESNSTTRKFTPFTMRQGWTTLFKGLKFWKSEKILKKSD